MLQQPIARGLLLCGDVYRIEGTGNAILVNQFVSLSVPSFPARTAPFVVFSLLSDGLGRWPMALTLTRLDTLEEVYRQTWESSFADPLRDVRMRIAVLECEWPVAGRYAVGLWAGEQQVAEGIVTLVQAGG